MSSTSTPGIVSQWWSHWFGSHSEAERQVKRLQNQGSNIVRLAHTAAMVMLVLISLATLITLGRSTFEAVQASVSKGQADWMRILALTILFTLVLCMDIAVFYGSSMIRVLWSRGAERSAMLPHAIVVVLVATLEGFTYWAMILTYEHPNTPLEYYVGMARAFGAPALAIYLTLAMVVSVTKSDILNVAAVQSGIVAVQQVSHLASATDTPIQQVWMIFDAASGATKDDARVHRMIQAVSNTGGVRYVESDPTPPNNGGTPILLAGVGEPDLQRVERYLLEQPHAKAADIASALGISELDAKRYVAKLMTLHLNNASRQYLQIAQ